MSLDENRALTRRWMEEIWHKGNLSVLDDFLDTNFVFNYAPPGVAPNKEAYKQAMNMFRDGCPDMKYDIKDTVAEGDKVVVRWVGRGTQTGEIMGITPTGKEVTVTGLSILQIVGGKITEEWTEMDTMGAMQQLGAFPSAE